MPIQERTALSDESLTSSKGNIPGMKKRRKQLMAFVVMTV
jgi:hypothetical protein